MSWGLHCCDDLEDLEAIDSTTREREATRVEATQTDPTATE